VGVKQQHIGGEQVLKEGNRWQVMQFSKDNGHGRKVNL
jgi:hypothetical protein